MEIVEGKACSADSPHSFKLWLCNYRALTIVAGRTWLGKIGLTGPENRAASPSNSRLCRKWETNLLTASSLRSQKSKDLAQLAKSKGIPGWHSMRKEQLIRALLKIAKKAGSNTRVKARNSTTSQKSSPRVNKTVRSDSRIARKLRLERNRAESLKNLALANELERSKASPQSDRIILIVRDPYWLQAYWEITKATVDRVRVALAEHWFDTKPVLRLLEVQSDTSSGAESMVREIPIHGGVRNWFVDVAEPPKSYRIALGYATSSGKFFLIAKSNTITTPSADHEAFDLSWSDIQNDHKKFYALSGGYSGKTVHGNDELQTVFEEKMRRPMNVPTFVQMGSGFGGLGREFDFEVDAHMVVHGKANPNANVTLAGEPVKLRSDGSFTVKMELPDKRQVLPIVASSRDGTQRRTTVLAVERNTKVMEPISKQFDELN